MIHRRLAECSKKRKQRQRAVFHISRNTIVPTRFLHPSKRPAAKRNSRTAAPAIGEHPIRRVRVTIFASFRRRNLLFELVYERAARFFVERGQKS